MEIAINWNLVSVSDVLKACQDRLEVFQTADFGKLSCHENTRTINHISRAIQRQGERTARREAHRIQGQKVEPNPSQYSRQAEAEAAENVKAEKVGKTIAATRKKEVEPLEVANQRTELGPDGTTEVTKVDLKNVPAEVVESIQPKPKKKARKPRGSKK